MTKQVTLLSVVGNVALLAVLVWMRAAHQVQLREVAKAAMQGDETHIKLHEASLAALESADPKTATATIGMLRTVIAAGEVNIESRKRAGLEER